MGISAHKKGEVPQPPCLINRLAYFYISVYKFVDLRRIRLNN